MKKTVFMIIIILFAFQVVGLSQKKKDREKIKTDTITQDSLEYRLIVLEPGFESWLATKPSKNYYSQLYYEQKNRLYVSEWNQRYFTSKNNGLYENYIDYNYTTDYGLDLNYKLYWYFRYFEDTYNVVLINTGR
jgi:hypothetical protein